MMSKWLRWSLASVVLVVGGCMRSEFTMSPAERQVLQRVDQSRLEQAEEAKVPKIRAQTRFAAGRLLEAQGRLNEAAEQYRRAVEEEPRFAEVHHHLGRLLSRVGNHEGAVKYLRRAAQLQPNNAAFHNDLGYVFMLQGSWADAENELQRAIELDNNFARATVNLGVCLGRQGRFDEAMVEFRRALPEPDAWYNLGLMYRGQQRYSEATSAFRRALELSPQLTAARTQIEQIGFIQPVVTQPDFPARPTQSAQVGRSEPRDDNAEANPTVWQGAQAGQSVSPPRQNDAPERGQNPVPPAQQAWKSNPPQRVIDPAVAEQLRAHQDELDRVRSERTCLEDAILRYAALSAEAGQKDRKIESLLKDYAFIQRNAPVDGAKGQDESANPSAGKAAGESSRTMNLQSNGYKPGKSHSASFAAEVIPVPPTDAWTMAAMHGGYDVSVDPVAMVTGEASTVPPAASRQRRASMSSTIQFATYDGDAGSLDAIWYDPAIQIAVCPPEGCGATHPAMDPELRQWIEEQSSSDEMFSILLNEIRCLEGERD
ncbi:MAG: tetratricopeptide repeat protein [Phycisphaerae bacterium]|nr:tetratricopeptide repeat protein [Phycisphaerae bacterium]